MVERLQLGTPLRLAVDKARLLRRQPRLLPLAQRRIPGRKLSGQPLDLALWSGRNEGGVSRVVQRVRTEDESVEITKKKKKKKKKRERQLQLVSAPKTASRSRTCSLAPAASSASAMASRTRPVASASRASAARNRSSRKASRAWASSRSEASDALPFSNRPFVAVRLRT